jgi:hypothetical protein
MLCDLQIDMKGYAPAHNSEKTFSWCGCRHHKEGRTPLPFRFPYAWHKYDLLTTHDLDAVAGIPDKALNGFQGGGDY